MSAFRVVAAGTVDALREGASGKEGAAGGAAGQEGALLWDSGKVRRREGADDRVDPPLLATRVEWGGRPLTSRQRVWWRVMVWDQLGRPSGWSEPASFSVGLLDQADWKGEWIGLDEAAPPPLTATVRDALRQLPWIRQPGGPEGHERVACFRGEFDLREGEVESAWVAGTADMIGAVWVNGVSVGELARWEPVRAIDVRSALKPGRNALAVRVEHHDGLNPAVTGMLVVRFAGGGEQRVPFDGTWKLKDGTEGGDGRSGAAPAEWRRAGFDESSWRPAEVSPGAAWGSSRNTEHFMPPAPYLRKTFAVSAEKRVTRATLYATALGLYQCQLNGARVGRAEFAPGWTEYAKRVEHQTYDVTDMIRSGENCLGAIVGDGWYAGLMGYTGQRRFYHGPARFKAQLEIEYGDGTGETIVSGGDWLAAFGPVRYTDNYMGSAYDSRLEVSGWDTAACSAGSWRPVEVGLGIGSSLRETDVTAVLRRLVSNGKLALRVRREVLGDPAYGVVKRLRVAYTAGGVEHEASAEEGQTLSLPRKGETGEFVITRATFGEPPAAPTPPPTIEPALTDPVRRYEELPTRSVSEPRRGRYVFDLGQNMVGWTRLRVSGTAGQRLVVRHAEMRNPDGTLYTSNLRGATATDFFTLKGGEEVLEPVFTFHGFRYVEITGLAEKPGAEMVTGVVAHSALAPAGTFSCSSPLVNRLVENIVWGQKGNYFEVPTDCPQRDERLGWTGDAQFFMNTAAYTFDVASFMSRWLKTLAQDAQFHDGTFAHVAPKVNERGGSTAWGDAAIVCTHALYTTYGDTRVIADNYDAMRRYMAWLDGRTTDGITHVGGFGDWLNLNDPTPGDLIDTAYRAELLRLMQEMALAIGMRADAAAFGAAHAATVDAFRARFVAPDGELKGSGQTGYALAFTMGLIPPEQRKGAAEHFARAVEGKNWHLATGFIGTPRLLPGLQRAGEESVAARLLLNEDYPSWLYQVKLGATTMWERWDGWTPERGFADVGMNSFNHYAFGSVGDYLYRHVAGIAPIEPGYARVLVAPTAIRGLEHAEATYDSVAGAVRSAWRRVPGAVEYEIAVPPNVSAEIELAVPGGAADVREGGMALDKVQGIEAADPAVENGRLRLRVGSGVYRFVVLGAFE